MGNDNRFTWSGLPAWTEKKVARFRESLNFFDENYYFEALVADSQSCDSAESPTAQQKRKIWTKGFVKCPSCALVSIFCKILPFSASYI